MRWHTEKIESVERRLETDISSGLSQDEAKKRLETYGLNALPQSKRTSWITIFFRQFANPIIYILFIAAAIVLLLGQRVDAIIIAIILIVNAIIGAIQEGKAQATLDALKGYLKTNASILRDGEEVMISDEHIVPGDIVVLREGDKVSADIRLVSSTSLKIDESALTGESESVTKAHDVIPPENAQIADQKNMLFRGTLAVSGQGRGIVVQTGLKTVMGSISQKLVGIDTEIPLKANIRALSRLIIIVSSAASVALFFIGVLKGFSVREMFATVVAIAVSVIPEGLPVVVTLILATGVRRMSKRNALVRKLQAVEALGQAKIIAVDKTGTLTLNQMMVERLITGGRDFLVSGKGYDPHGTLRVKGTDLYAQDDESVKMCGRIASFTAFATVAYSESDQSWQRVGGDPTEAALFVFGEKTGSNRNQLLEDSPVIVEMPFDSTTRYHASLNSVSGKAFLSVTGAPETVLSLCRDVFSNKGIKKISKEIRASLEDQVLQMSYDGLRVLALAFSDRPPKEIDPNKLPHLIFAGFIGISDTLRPGVSQSVREATDSGIKIVMITGDHAETAKVIGKRAGIYHPNDEVITGAMLRDLSRGELLEILPKVSIFARISPEDKLTIIEAYRENGDIVAMTGDGVNDALSLAAADLGVAMGKIGTEVAKEAADIVLLDDNFKSIVYAVEEGRNIYATLKKVILYLFSTSAGEILVIAVAIFLGLPLPIVASQIIWLNFVTDGFLVAALAVEPKERLKNRFFTYGSLFDKKTMGRLVAQAITMMVGTIILFASNLDRGYIVASTMAVTGLAVFQWFNIFNCRSGSDNFSKMFSLKNKFLTLSIVIVVILQFFAVYSRPLQTVLHTTAIGWLDWLVIILSGMSILFVDLIWKTIFRDKNLLVESGSRNKSL